MTVNSQQITSEQHDSPTTPTALAVGTSVEVRSRFDSRWARGFSVAAVARDAYQLRRLSDGSVLPAWFPPDEIRKTILR